MTPRTTFSPRRLGLFLLSVSLPTTLAELSKPIRDLQDEVSAHPGFLDLAPCGRCRIVQTDDCSELLRQGNQMDVVVHSGCTNISCLCSTDRREDLVDYVETKSDSTCDSASLVDANDDTITPGLAAAWFNDFCDAQPASSSSSSSAQDESSSGSDSSNGSGQSINGDGNSITNTDEDSSNAGSQCGTGNNNNGSIVCNQDGGRSSGDTLGLGLGLGLGIPTVVIAALTL